MVNKILTAAGLQGRQGRFIGDKPLSYVVWLDNITTDGSDDRPCIFRHDITLELYEDKPDPAVETALELAIADAKLQFTKQDRYWLQTEQQYQVIYEFTYYEKRRI